MDNTRYHIVLLPAAFQTHTIARAEGDEASALNQRGPKNVIRNSLY